MLVADLQRNTLSSFDILADALKDQVESRARRDDAAWRSVSAHDDAAIMAAIHPIPHLDLRTELRHDSIVEYQLLQLALVAHRGLAPLICVFLDADNIALVLFALRDADGIEARGEARTGVFESVADVETVNEELAFSDFALEAIACNCNEHKFNI